MKKQNVFLSIIIFLFIALRLYLILTSQYHLDGDRSIEGIMAKHIAEKGVHPIFIYGTHYGGSVSAVAHLTSMLFMIFGVSALHFKLIALFISLTFIIASFYFTKKFFSKDTAFLTIILLTFSPILFTKLNINIPAYMIALLLSLTAIWLFFEIFYNKKDYEIALGIIFGISWWASELIIPTILVILIFFYLNDKLFFTKKRFIKVSVSFIIGMLPLIYYNLANNFANLKQFFAGNIIHKIACDYNLVPKTLEFGGKIVEHCAIFGTTRDKTSMLTFFSTLPEFFSDIKFIGMIISLIFIASLIMIVFKHKKNISAYLRSILPSKRYDLKTSSLSPEIFITSFMAVFIFALLLSGTADSTHLMPIYPYVMIIMSAFILKLDKKTAAILVVFLMISSSYSIYALAQENDSEDYSDIISFLEDNNIKYAYATHFVKWKLLFQSEENIIISCQDLCPCMYRYPEYEQTVERSDRYAYIFGEERPLNIRFQEYLDSTNITYEKTTIIGHDIYYNFSKELRPKTAIPSCTHYEG